ncbi:hypothetical protein ASG01_12165 [Chryseobacterium sp. Leaf180]|jgi:hypothetical protein|uniref:DUF4082 domain-containing protein n=1 Tax=Chryseobacterium sp. Leaf180 TaxID=1736289 RepID=UPI0006FD0D45|nr:DUF4082 domain-containing protein [Chryseobacterium sp. Leaf180]KQR92648.1 hypothetical protein ASG01_12165 [Chryseobacterium sp. Leaf180]
MNTRIFMALFAISTIIGCSKEEDEVAAPAKVYAEENPLAAYVANSGFNQTTTNFINAGSYEFGLRFTPKVKGKINAITVNIPDNATTLRVTIWDAEAKTVLRTVNISNVVANTEKKETMDPLTLQKDGKYAITFNSNDWYNRTKTGNAPTNYPITAGNFVIEGYNWASGTTQAFPTSVSNAYYAGDLGFVFQQMD